MASLFITAAAYAGVSVSSPSPGATTGSPVHFVASASASTPISAMRIYVDNNNMYTVSASSLDTNVSLGNGSHSVAVVAWDSNGTPYKQTFSINVSGSAPPSGSGVTVSAPTDGATVGSPIQVTASANLANGVSAMRIYLDGSSMYTVNSNSINTTVPASTGSHTLAVVAWDNTGAGFKQTLSVNVGSGSPPGGSGVSISSPSDGSTVSSPMQVTASVNVGSPIAATWIYLDGNSVYQTQSSQVNTTLNASSGSHSLVVQAWDTSGNVYKKAITVNISGGGGGGVPGNATTFNQIQQMSGWGSCTVCAGSGGSGPSADFSTTQWVSSPSLSGASMLFWLGGSTPWSDALWWKDVTPNDGVSNFQYDLDFYMTNPGLSQALEFDVNQSQQNGTYFIFGTQCDIQGSGAWDVWDTANARWVPTSVACSAPSAYTWHHLTWEFYQDGSKAHFVALTLDGVKHYVNMSFWGKAPDGSGINVAFQMDGNFEQDAYKVWLDNVTLSYW